MARTQPTETILQRAHAHPFVLALGAMLVLFHAVTLTGEIAGLPFGSWFSFNAHDLHAGAFLFPFCNFPPISSLDGVHRFSSLDFLASFVVFLLVGASLLKCGARMESHYSTKGLFVLFLLTSGVHALLAGALPSGVAFGTLAFAVFLVVSDLLVHLNDSRKSNEAEIDIRMSLLVAIVSVSAVAAGFLSDPSWGGHLVALASGGLVGVCAYVAQRRYQLRLVRKQGSGSVGGLYFVDETELLTRDEIQSRMDRLLDKIGAQGMESLTGDEQRFMKQASRRIKAIEEESASD